MTSGTDAPAFEEYASDAWPSLYRHAYLLTGNHADAEDIAQQTLLKAYRSWSRICRSDSLEAYLRRILTNTFLSARRPKKRRFELLTDTPPEHDSTPVHHGPEDRLMLWPYVKSLPPRQRVVIVLRYYEDLTEQEIADTLGCSRGTVKSQAHRALKALRAAMGSERADGRES
ncbi:SigE family RNA polymerase sigma factor [Actinopolymorpha alba]|uniref:SigE family RNA polymerase sigma factor n=1 Tax=Actinopolymorpha alba TaxID=533267 RepID=UPI001ED9AAF6|nr:SigE family RNA polymerase sigma factor [Actinopolymorpha alba]